MLYSKNCINSFSFLLKKTCHCTAHILIAAHFFFQIFMFISSLSFKRFEETTEDQNDSEMVEGKNLKSLEKPKNFKERYV